MEVEMKGGVAVKGGTTGTSTTRAIDLLGIEKHHQWSTAEL